VNRGIEQQRLDGVENPIVDVIGLAPHVQTPHVELLHYHREAAGVPLPMKANDMACIAPDF
jgi:hypothetical protein